MEQDTAKKKPPNQGNTKPSKQHNKGEKKNTQSDTLGHKQHTPQKPKTNSTTTTETTTGATKLNPDDALGTLLALLPPPKTTNETRVRESQVTARSRRAIAAMKVLSDEWGMLDIPGVKEGKSESRIKLASVWVVKDPDNPDLNPQKNEKQKKEICADFETAIELTGSGMFNCFLMLICGSVIANAAVSVTANSFVLPSAQCDFNLSSEDKGRMNVAPNIGMMLGALVWGLLADAKGRKWMIFSGLLLDATFTFVSGVVQNYWIFLISRLLCGFGTMAVNALAFAYVGEFLSSAKRDRMLCWLEISWSIAITVQSGVASLLIPQTWHFVIGPYLIVSSWRVFVLLCGVLSLVNGLLLLVLPESPKYLMSKDRLDEALLAFKWIHRVNNGKGQEYAVTSLQPPEVDGLVSAPTTVEAGGEAESGGKRTCVRRLCVPLFALGSHLKALFTRPLLAASALTTTVQTILMTSYFTLVLWFPDLFDRFERFQSLYPNQTASICEVTAAVAGAKEEDVLSCVAGGQGVVPAAVFHHAAYVGVACIIAGVMLIATIDLLGKRTILVMTMVIAGVCTLGFNFVQTSTQNLILACIFEGFSGIGISVLMCAVVEIMPTDHRAFAMAFQQTTGRIGAIIGNILFGWLVDFHCNIPLFIGGILLIGGGLLSLAIPKGKEHQLSRMLS